jgi:hypothetical protein
MEANRRGPRPPGRHRNAGTRPATAEGPGGSPEYRARLAIVEQMFREQDQLRRLADQRATNPRTRAR